MCPPKKAAISDKWEAVLVSFKGSNKHQTKLITLEWIECKSDLDFDDIQSNVVVPDFNHDIKMSFKEKSINWLTAWQFVWENFSIVKENLTVLESNSANATLIGISIKTNMNKTTIDLLEFLV